MKQIFRYLIYVDDERSYPKEYDKEFDKVVLCKSYSQAESWIKRILDSESIVYVDLDHDLGGKRTGYDLAKIIVTERLPISAFRCHSMNPVGKKNIQELLIHYGYKEF